MGGRVRVFLLMPAHIPSRWPAIVWKSSSRESNSPDLGLAERAEWIHSGRHAFQECFCSWQVEKSGTTNILRKPNRYQNRTTQIGDDLQHQTARTQWRWVHTLPSAAASTLFPRPLLPFLSWTHARPERQHLLVRRIAGEGQRNSRRAWIQTKHLAGVRLASDTQHHTHV